MLPVFEGAVMGFDMTLLLGYRRLMLSALGGEAVGLCIGRFAGHPLVPSRFGAAAIRLGIGRLGIPLLPALFVFDGADMGLCIGLLPGYLKLVVLSGMFAAPPGDIRLLGILPPVLPASGTFAGFGGAFG
jgi:hypothetical protein